MGPSPQSNLIGQLQSASLQSPLDSYYVHASFLLHEPQPLLALTTSSQHPSLPQLFGVGACHTLSACHPIANFNHYSGIYTNNSDCDKHSCPLVASPRLEILLVRHSCLNIVARMSITQSILVSGRKQAKATSCQPSDRRRLSSRSLRCVRAS